MFWTSPPLLLLFLVLHPCLFSFPIERPVVLFSGFSKTWLEFVYFPPEFHRVHSYNGERSNYFLPGYSRGWCRTSSLGLASNKLQHVTLISVVCSRDYTSRSRMSTSADVGEICVCSSNHYRLMYRSEITPTRGQWHEVSERSVKFTQAIASSWHRAGLRPPGCSHPHHSRHPPISHVTWCVRGLRVRKKSSRCFVRHNQL